MRIPLIVADPSPAADATRGLVRSELVEAIDLLPTFVEVAGGTVPRHILEGHSLLPLLHDPAPRPLREAVFSEYDYSCRLARRIPDRGIPDCRLQMVFDGRWKMIRAEGFRPLLFDLRTDPQELHDLGADPAMLGVLRDLESRLTSWATSYHSRITRSDADIAAYAGTEFHAGILIGFWDEADLCEATAIGEGGN